MPISFGATYEGILHLTGAMRGATGTTELKGATRARVELNQITRELRPGGALVPAKLVTVGAKPQVIVETESREEEVAAYAPTDLVETIIVGYRDSAGRRKRTHKYCQLSAIRTSTFPPVEDDKKSAERMELVFSVCGNFDVTADTFAEIFVDAVDA